VLKSLSLKRAPIGAAESVSRIKDTYGKKHRLSQKGQQRPGWQLQVQGRTNHLPTAAGLSLVWLRMALLVSCRQAFTFALGVELATTWEELAITDWKGWGMQRVSKKNIASWVTDMKRLLADVKPGQVYVCLDGRLFEKDARKVAFDGIYASHAFDQLPHVQALTDRSVEEKLLASTDYWRSHKLKRKKK